MVESRHALSHAAPQTPHWDAPTFTPIPYTRGGEHMAKKSFVPFGKDKDDKKMSKSKGSKKGC